MKIATELARNLIRQKKAVFRGFVSIGKAEYAIIERLEEERYDTCLASIGGVPVPGVGSSAFARRRFEHA
jgi:hypothetical protein